MLAAGAHPSGKSALSPVRISRWRPIRPRLPIQGLELHLIADNYATYKHPKVKAWLERHPRFKMHFTPTSSSRFNLVERFFAEDVIPWAMAYVRNHRAP